MASSIKVLHLRKGLYPLCSARIWGNANLVTLRVFQLAENGHKSTKQKSCESCSNKYALIELRETDL